MKLFLVLPMLVLAITTIFSQEHHSQSIDDELEVFGINKKIPFSLTGYIYLLNEGIPKLPPKFIKKYSIGTINTNKLDIPVRKFENGFPGISDRDEWFAIDYHGFFYIKDADTYHFALESDDGSKLFINDELIINNDGEHSPETKYGKLFLKKGVHSMNVQYFQGPRFLIALRLLYKKEGADDYEVFSYDDFKPVSISDFKNENDNKVEGLLIEMEGSILFDFDDDLLKENAKLIIKEIYHSFAENDTIGIVIEGHTDDRGTNEYNKNLALKRAKSVETFLNSEFNIAGRMWSIGVGETVPKYSNNNEENRSKNRRVEILLMNKSKAKDYYLKNTTVIYR